MKLKTKLYSLTALLHGSLFATVYWFYQTVLAQQSALVLLTVELVLIGSFVLFILLINKILSPFDYLTLFKNILKEEEFTARFSQTGNHELDTLLNLFNKMLNNLYQERLKLGDRRAMLQQLMDAIPLSIIVFDFNQNISQLNPAAQSLFDFESAELLDKPLSRLQQPLAKALNKLPTGESKLISDNNGKRYRCTRNHFSDRGFDREFIIIQELTGDLKHSEKQTYDKLIRLMSHEVNNTMAATSSVLKSCLHYAHQIEEDVREDYQTAMQLVIERTDNLNQFMQEYAQVVRLPKPALESCNIYHILLTCQRLFAAKLHQENIELILPIIANDEQLAQWQISADQNQLEQVLINLIKNAIEATAEKHNANSTNFAKIVIIPEFTSLHFNLKIHDSGPGLNSENQQQLFTPFFTTKAQGQGIGLMLVAEILDAHDFTYSLYNHQSGGACFEIGFSSNGKK